MPTRPVPAEQPATAPAASANPLPAEPDPTQGVPAEAPVREIGGPAGPEPTRYGDWERKGRCIDF